MGIQLVPNWVPEKGSEGDSKRSLFGAEKDLELCLAIDKNITAH